MSRPCSAICGTSMWLCSLPQLLHSQTACRCGVFGSGAWLSWLSLPILTPVCMQVHPATAGDVLSGILDIYSEHATAAARSGTAIALATCSEHIRTEDVPKALDFLLGQALADPSDAVRCQMVEAGARCCKPLSAVAGLHVANRLMTPVW